MPLGVHVGFFLGSLRQLMCSPSCRLFGRQENAKKRRRRMNVIERLLGPLPYFWFGVRHAARFSSGFAREGVLRHAMEYAQTSQLEGDYLEFGVWRGRAFAAACYFAKKCGLNMNFYAFDSFRGIPQNDE